MTAIDESIKEFVKDRVGGVIVNGTDGDIFYQDSRIVLSTKGVDTWNRKRPMMNERKTWEFTDVDAGKYYRVETATISKSGTDYQCHLFTDVSDYATLFQDISDYSKRISDMNDFQKNILSKLSQDYDSFLPELTEFCHATDSILYMEQSGTGYIRKSSYGTRLNRCRISSSKEMDGIFHTERFGLSDGYYCFLSEQTEDQRYALFLRRGAEFNEEYFRDASVYNVIRLYIENGILREKILFESEHDGLTGLYNKGKYISMQDGAFKQAESIAVFYFDVNNLKTVNDTLGHEAGDRLIKRAAESIKCIADEEIYAFRMGGDEFVVVAPNISEEATRSMEQTWNNALTEINSTKEDPITIACGIEYAAKPYVFDEVVSSADEKMYKNKKEMKERLGLPERR